MSVLTHRLPQELEVGGKIYPINADFRNCLLILEAFEDETLTIIDSQEIMIELLFCDEIPLDFLKAQSVAVEFMNLGEKLETRSKKPIYSFTQDAKYIRSAMQSKYRVRLDELEFWHWWDFCYAFFDLEGTFLNELMGVRNRIQNGTASKEDKKYAQKNADIVNIVVRNAEAPHLEADDEFKRRYEAAKRRRNEAR